MDPDTTPQDPVAEETEGVPQTPRPRLRDYFWRPRVVKLWWMVSAVWWTAFALSPQTGWLKDFFQATVTEYIHLVFHPFTIVGVQGFRFLRAEFRQGLWVWTQPTHEQMFPPRSVGGMRNPYVDRLDPRSGLLHWRWFHRGD